MTAFLTTIFSKTTIDFESADKKSVETYLGLLKSEKASTITNLGYDPLISQIFVFRLLEPNSLPSHVSAGSLATIRDSTNPRLNGATVRVLSIPTRSLEIVTRIVGSKILLLLESKNYLHN